MTAEIRDGSEGGSGARMRAEDRREQLITVAIGLFARKGFSGTTTKEIAMAAGVTEALIFRHFPTKDALYEAILRWKVERSRHSDQMATLRALVDKRDDVGLFRAVAHGILEFHRENLDFLRLMFYAVLEKHQLAESFRERHIKPFYDFLVDYIVMRQREGAFREVDPVAAVRTIVGVPFYHSINVNLFGCPILDVSDDEAVDAFVRIALDGLRRPEGTPVNTEQNEGSI